MFSYYMPDNRYVMNDVTLKNRKGNHSNLDWFRHLCTVMSVDGQTFVSIIVYMGR